MDQKAFTISYWREEFTIEKKRLGKGWRKLLIGKDSRYASYDAAALLNQVSAGRASLTRTVRVVSDMRSLVPEADNTQHLKEYEKNTTRQAAIAQSLNNLERPAQRVLRDGKARREKIKADYKARLDGHHKKKVNQ